MLDVQAKFAVPLVDLATRDERYAGIHAPLPELDMAREGITTQFLQDAATYHERYAASAHWQAMFERVFEKVGLPSRPAPDILDIGTGSGANTVVPLLNLLPGARILGADLSPQLLAMLRAYVVENGLEDRVACICTDAARDFFQAECVDFATGGSILHHLVDPIPALKAVRRTLRPGGMAVFFEPFEGYSVIRAAFTLILERAAAGGPGLAPTAEAFLRAMIRDHEVRAGRDKSDPIYRHLDDKWLFTRTYVAEAAKEAGFAGVEIIPMYPPARQYRQCVANLLAMAGPHEPDAFPGWAWDIVDTFDASFSDDLKGEATLESGIVFLTRRHGSSLVANGLSDTAAASAGIHPSFLPEALMSTSHATVPATSTVLDREPTRVLETIYGSMDAPAAEADLIGRFLAEYGEWGLDEARFLAALLGDGARVLDGGAFLGTFGLGLLQFRELGLLCCVEANPAVAPLLEANLRRNGKGGAVAVGALLGTGEEEPRAGRGEPGNLGSTSFAKGAAGERVVPTQKGAMTLRSLRDRFGDFDLIKLDLEGMEHEVLAADAAHLASGETTLWIECNEGPSAPQLAKLLLSWGLDLWYFAFPSYNPDNFRGNGVPAFRWAYEAGLLAAPRQTPVLDPVLTAHRCILWPIRSVEDLAEAMWRTPRWLPTELDDADEAMLAGVASHALQGLSRDDFLSRMRNPKGWFDAKPSGAGAREDRKAILAALDAKERLRMRTQEELEEAQRVVASQQAEISALRQAVAQAEELAEARLKALEEAEGLNAAHLAELESVKQLRELTQRGLEQAQDIALAHLLELQDERRARQAAELRLAQSCAASLDRLGEVEPLREQLVALERAQGALTGQLSDLERARAAEVELLSERLRAIQLTPAWRAAQRAHRFVATRPRLHGGLRRFRAAIGKALGRRG